MSVSPARIAAVEPLIEAARRFPDLGPPRLLLDNLTGADTALAMAIYRTTIQRWLTLEHLLDRVAKRPMAKTDPTVRAVMLAGACQLVFLSGITDYAAVDESVMLVRKFDQPQAAGAVNAVLRKVAKMVGERSDEPWEPARDALPIEGGTLKLTSPLLPKTDNLVQHLAVATSHPLDLVTRWHKQFGRAQTLTLCLHDLRNPPTFVVDEAGTISRWVNPWSELAAYLAADPLRRVQDPTSAGVIESVASLEPARILDYCAGKGTKTRQLAARFPDAEIVATDTHAERFKALRELEGIFKNVKAVSPERVIGGGAFDLVLLDVPCSNSGVLARRAEARYRLNAKHVDELVALQREIVATVAPRIAPDGVLLYATCSIEPAENDEQAAWASEQFGAVVTTSKSTLPGGNGGDYHDGGYHAVLRWPAVVD